MTVALKDDGSIKDSFTMTVTDKGTVDPDPDPTPKPNPDPQKLSGDNKPQIKPEAESPVMSRRDRCQCLWRRIGRDDLRGRCHRDACGSPSASLIRIGTSDQ